VQKIIQELTVLTSIRKRTLFALALLCSLFLSVTLTALDNVASGVVDGAKGTHLHDPRK
jgi:hypothetical protein